MNDIIDALKKFRDERDWQQFHNPKDLSMALSIEAAELLEGFSAAVDRDQTRLLEGPSIRGWRGRL
jgi:NTP pyrophosphatase (non-canonical NTP hydrolase)